MRQVRYKIGGEELLDHNIVNEGELNCLDAYNPQLAYGQSKPENIPAFIPDYVKFDNKVLGFKVYSKETIRESPNETYRVRYFEMFYYLADNTMLLTEHKVNNSGIPQGKLINRCKMPKNSEGDVWEWIDLNVGMNLNLYGRVYHVYACDDWTREWLECEGIEVNENEEAPKDMWTEHRKKVEKGPERVEGCQPTGCVKLCQFLKLDRKVLRFYAVMDEFDQFYKNIRMFVIQYYLADDTIDIKEVHHRNDGMSNFPFLLLRHRVPKDRYDLDPCFNTSILEITETEVKEFFSPKDFGIGKTVLIYNRPFLIYNCDNFTRAYYWKHYCITDFTPIDIAKKYPAYRKKDIPPWNLHGSLDDSMQNVRGVHVPPRRDDAKMLNYQGVVLRYLLQLVNPHPIESCRRFVMSYDLSGDTISIYEMPSPGFVAGKFLFRIRVPKPSTPSIDEPVFYGPEDFAIDSTIEVFSRKFRITDADQYVLTFMEENSYRMPPHVVESIRKKLCGRGDGGGDAVAKQEEKDFMVKLAEKPYKDTMDKCCPPIQRSAKDSC